MQIRVGSRQRGNIFVGVFVLVVGAVVIWKLYVTAKTLLPDTPVAPPPPQASNSIPTTPPNVTVSSYWVGDGIPTSATSGTVVVYGLLHTQKIGIYWQGQPTPMIPAMSASTQSGGTLGQMSDALSSYGINAWDWDLHAYTGAMTVWGLYGFDSGGLNQTGYYPTSLQRSTNGVDWTTIDAQLLHGGMFVICLDTNQSPTCFYRVVMDDEKPVVNPAAISGGMK